MKVLIIGNGGREHAVALKLKESKRVTQLYCAPGNGGIAGIATCVNIGPTDVAGMVDFAKQEGIDFVVVTPDDPLALGMVDAMEQAGIPAFGPNAAAARIEASKIFSKELMKKYGVPTANFAVFDDINEAKAYIRQHGAPLVVKADGLAKGKGVIIAKTMDEAMEAVHDMMEEQVFGKAGTRILIEDMISGPEASIMCFADGETIVPMVSSQDHKRALDGDQGLNTGGMGAFAPSPHITDELLGQIKETILLPTMRGMKAEGCPFHGVLYAGIMLTEQGPMTLEFNARFGDPETQAVLPLLESDLLEIMVAVREGRLNTCQINWKKGASAVIVMASGGYPSSYQTGYPISGLDQVEDVQVFHAGTKLKDGQIVTDGGRVLGVAATGDTLKETLDRAYRNVEKIHFEKAHFRTDIGQTLRGV